MHLAVAVWFGSSALLAQTDGVEKALPTRALALLQSAQQPERAWGAYLCGVLSVESCRAPLLLELERAASFIPTAADDSREFFYVQAVLDGVIRTGVVAPPALVVRFDPRWRDEVIILLARNSNSEEALLRLEELELTTAEWTAVSNQLLQLRSRPFFVRMLQQTEVRHYFDVYDVDAVGGYAGGIGDGVYVPHIPIRRVPPEFPPVGIYQIGIDGSPGQTLLNSGPCPRDGTASYSRTEITETGTKVRPRHRSPAVRSVECRNSYLAAFNGIPPEAAGMILHPVTKIRWTNAAAFIRETNAALEIHSRELRQFIDTARIADLVDPTTFKVMIQATVTDRREAKTVPLPKVSPREVRLD